MNRLLFLFCIYIFLHYHAFSMNTVPRRGTSAEVIKETCYQLLNDILDIHGKTLKQYTLMQKFIDCSPSLGKKERIDITDQVKLWVNELADRKNTQIAPIHTILSDIKTHNQIQLQKSDLQLLELHKSVLEYVNSESDRLHKLKDLIGNILGNRMTPMPSRIQ